MPRIYQLDPHVADLIAAGEVVERPASVVKELTENAIDAGAAMVTVEIQHGGMSYIRVTDNGSGIEPEDCLVAFLRHATSKIRTETDLEAIGTLGFRGEALAAISAVSKVELMTRTQDNAAGTALLLDGGAVRTREEVGCPVGTTMIVRDLFFNTPARQKFMKRDSAEGAAVFAVVQHAALSHPEVAFRFIREGREDMNTPGDGTLKSAMYAVLGRDLALGFVPCRGSGDEITVEGFVSQPVCCRGSRSSQYFFVNGRYVKSRTMQAALEQAYQNRKMVGKFPGCVLHIGTRLSGVDVNVHPTKTEVKFTSEKKLFDAIYYAVLGALEAKTDAPRAVLETPKKAERHDTVTPNQTFLASDDRGGFRASLHSDVRAPYEAQAPHRTVREEPDAEPIVTVPYVPAFPKKEDSARPTERFVPTEQPAQPLKRPPMPAASEKSIAAPEPDLITLPEPDPIAAPEPEPAPMTSAAPEPEPASMTSAAPEPENGSATGQTAPVTPDTPAWRMAGEVLNTYVIVEQGDEVWLIDKHAAHERMNFNRLKAMHHKPMSQILLTPLILHPEPEECAALLEHLDLLSEFAFAAEEFGGGTILVREAPDYLPLEEIAPALSEIAAKLIATGTADPDAARDEVLHTMACKSAIKGGWKNGEEELLAVCRAVMSDEVRYCPHGRPVAIRLTRKDLEKQFKRT